MKRPAFQFYPGDWRGNANLRRCSHAERGVWIEVMCLMHDSEEYGVLRWPLADIAQAAGCKVAELRALAAKGVLKGGDDRCEAFVYTPRHAGQDGSPVTLLPDQDGPVWYSSRMVRDEYVRTKRGIGSRFAEKDPAPKPSPKPPIGDGPSSSLFSLQSSNLPPSPKKRAKSALPDGWQPKPETVQALAAEFSWRNGEAERYVTAFADACRAKGYTYVDFDAAFRNCVRQDWPRLRSTPTAGAEDWRKELNFVNRPR